jgi:hypothetical protein
MYVIRRFFGTGFSGDRRSREPAGRGAEPGARKGGGRARTKCGPGRKARLAGRELHCVAKAEQREHVGTGCVTCQICTP